MVAWKDKFINKNKYSRPMYKLLSVKKLVVHYTANNGGTADNHFSYFNNLKDRYASAHIFVDKKEALCIVPLNEVAYHANDNQKYVNGKPYRGIPELLATASYYKDGGANLTSVGVEMCMEKDGSFHPDVISRTVDVFADLCTQFSLDPIKDIVRHYDITAKNCPAPWVKNEKEFIRFKNRVVAKLISVSPPPPQQEKLMWGKVELKPNQIGKVTILKPINLWKRDNNNKLNFVRILNEGEEYRVYDYDELHGGQYDVGASHYVTKMEGYIKYETPSKALLAKAKELYG
ncbi:peptidoglycan recognition protein family protein [Cytobacillus praedii]|uniref:peptidoglycan recognition protein family protein n=1 Tax=Cytobacillus praedii TaxID=1742358 RepID=UPI002418A2E8|nr:N-acetylmuramoyl-L-alanine amidase [Cytobacillus praedii]